MKLSRNIDSLSMLNPLQYGDSIFIHGAEWVVKQGGYGWQLRDSAGKIHPVIKDIPAMSEFISMIKYEAQ